ncbi:MAG: Qat anti-phage system QueC-like protein QatC [Candidatus Sumerlaeia bacterium]|nr:Qat anti-phage system QueC-like protein QatC [Candidatus Sumerlaeia bacterium]
MRREIAVSVSPNSDRVKESASLSLHFEGQAEDVVLDVNASGLLRVSRAVPDIAQDFLCIASCIYAADKAVDRKAEEDKWTRHLAIEIPVEHVDTWTEVADDLSDCIGFLTGDRWEISFRHGEKRLVQKKQRSRQVRFKRAAGDAVCLFSGGLDSFIGAVDWLHDNSTKKLLLVGHYDGDVSGPKSDQNNLQKLLRNRYPDRFELAQTRVGLSSGGADTNFRSRSLLFIALGCYFAELLGPNAPVLIPENGPIALNFPLTPARRGSCSTRTVHPYFLTGLNSILRRVGVINHIQNPYELKTKGEMVEECRDQLLLSEAYSSTRSCAKSSRRGHWINMKGISGKAPLGCGVCIPCLFRRSALYQRGLDIEVYGIPVEQVSDFDAGANADLLALVAFLRRGDSKLEIAAGLLGNGQLPLESISEYIELVERMRSEVLTWLRASGSKFLKKEIRGC